MIRLRNVEHVSSVYAYRQCDERQGIDEIDDAVAATIASWWQSSGTAGSAFAALASGAPVDHSAVLNDVWASLLETDSGTRDRLALEMLATWAINHHCTHRWVAGMMYVDDADADEIAAVRRVECEKCEAVYDAEIHSIYA